MFNTVTKVLLKKEIILIGKHRNSNPLVNDINKSKYIFVNPIFFWKLTYFFGRKSKLRYNVMALILNLISPKYIIDINWTERIHTLYFVWCNKKNKKFIVIQHGTYVAGLITNDTHQKTKCNIFFAWSGYFVEILKKHNEEKKIKYIIWGNPLYNQYERDLFKYKTIIGNRILIVPSLLLGKRLQLFELLINNLSHMGFEVVLKEHIFQPIMSVPLKCDRKFTGSLHKILEEQHFDIVITDVSTAMCDIIFFKNLAVFFSPPAEEDYYIKNVYADFMKNLGVELDLLIQKEELFKYIDIEAQESLLQFLFSKGSNNLDRLL